MKGYKAANGNYITGKEIEQSRKRFKKKMDEYRKQKIEEEKRQDIINLTKYRQEKKDERQYIERVNRINVLKDKILLSLRKNNPFTYRQYLIIWDIVITSDYDQILSDRKRNKITVTDIKNVIEYIETYSKELISEYWKERLISI